MKNNIKIVCMLQVRISSKSIPKKALVDLNE